MIGTRVANTLRYDPRLCINCGMCLAVCPHEVFAPDNHAVRLVNPAACMECGACQRNCPTGAVTVDSGVGCATAMIWAALTGGEVSCGGDSPLSCCGGSSDEAVTCDCSEQAAEASPAERWSACCGGSGCCG